MKQLRLDYGPSAAHILQLSGSLVLFLWAFLCSFLAQLMRGTGWGFLGILAVTAVIVVSFAGFLVISAVAILGACIAAVWSIASRLSIAGRFLLRWAAV